MRQRARCAQQVRGGATELVGPRRRVEHVLDPDGAQIDHPPTPLGDDPDPRGRLVRQGEGEEAHGEDE
jgi:hypothetical protein